MADNEENLNAPRFTRQLLGHAKAEQSVLDAFNSGRLAHAWLISGPKGIGKATLAWRMAKFLLTQPSDEGPGLFGESLPSVPPESLVVDPENDNVQRIERGGHGGLMLVERTLNQKTGKMRKDIVVDDVRKLISFYSQTSAEGGWRVAIVDAADEMNSNAANALLKVLEEPPEKSILILLAHAPGRLLPTITSRCRSLKMKSLADSDVRAIVADRYPGMGDEEANTLAKLAAGAPGRAVELAANDGVGLYRQMGGLIRDLPRLNVPALHALAVQLGSVKADSQYRLFLQIYDAWLERLIRQASTGLAEEDTMQGESEQIARISALSRVDRWLELWEKMNRLVARADSVNLDRKQVIVSLFTSLAAVSRGQ